MATAHQLIDYLRKCYEADNRETGITSLLHSKIRHVRWLDAEELVFSGTLPRIPLPRSYGETLRKETFKYRRDKTLVYAAFPVVGSGQDHSRLPRQVCAPLCWLQAGFEEVQGSLFLVPDTSQLTVNFPVLLTLAEAGGGDAAQVERFLSELPPLPWPRTRLHALAAELAEVMPAVDWTTLAQYPELHSAAGVRQRCESAASTWQCLSAAAIALLPNSPETRGVLFELASLKDLEHQARPTNIILRGERPQPRSASMNAWPITPSVLSDAQRQVLASSATNPLTLVIGPPGTGKSHTIASIALDHLSRRQTVLIASRMDQAVDVVANKIDNLIGPTEAVVRAGRKEHRRELKRKLENLLQGISLAGSNAASSASDVRSTARRLRRLDRWLADRERSLRKRRRREIAWGELQAMPSAGGLNLWFEELAKRWHTWQLGEVSLWEHHEEYERQLELRSQLAAQLLTQTLATRVAQLLKRRRGDLTKFLQAIRARSDSKQQDLFNEIDFSVLLHAFPVWLCKLSDLSNVLPFQRELFDVAILDEATQCDIASCLPLFHRARRVVVVGDPKQLRHLSFLPVSRQTSLAEECQLTEQQQQQFHFRDKSILDAVSDALGTQAQVVFLNEHFRSLPQIVRFSNEEFYENSLAIMQDRPQTYRQRAVEVHATDGTRDAQGCNHGEAERLVEELARFVEEDSHADGESVPSIGVLSPFRDQVDLLSQIIDRHLTYQQLERHDLLVGTAHSFQGEERDVMFLSLAVDAAAHAATWRYLNTPNLLNVSITRARRRQHVFLSFDPQQTDKQSLLHRWLHSLVHVPREPEHPHRPVDPFRSELVAHCQRLGYRVWKDYSIAGVSMDLIIEAGERCLAVDLIGYPAQLVEAYSLERYRMIRRAGLKVVPLSYRDWHGCQSDVLARIAAALQLPSGQAAASG